MKTSADTKPAAEPAQNESATPLGLVDERTAAREERVPLRWGKLLRVTSEEDRERVVVVNARGGVELTLELTESGARLVLDAADVELRAARNVAVACDTFKIAARTFEVEATERASITAADAAVTATTGDVVITANDDVKVNGERVLLNSDGDLKVPDWMKRELGARLASEAAAPAVVPVSDVSGDEDLLSALDHGGG
jgi:hypothetical protein